MAMPVVVGVGAAASGQAAVTAAYPGGYTATTNDIGIIFQECENADTPAAPSGWSIIVTQALTSGTTSKLTAMWRRIQAGDTAPSVPDPGNHQTVTMIVVSGCITAGNPWDVFTNTTELVSDTSVSVPGVTTTVNNCLILAAFGTGQDVNNTTALTWVNGSLANLAHRRSSWTALGTGGGFAFCTGEKAAFGGTGATTTTAAVAANFKTLMTIALKEEVAAAGGPPPILVMAPPRA